MRQPDTLHDELGVANDLWTLLNGARKIAKDHEYFGPKLSDTLSDCVNLIESYQDELLALMHPGEFSG